MFHFRAWWASYPLVIFFDLVSLTCFGNDSCKYCEYSSLDFSKNSLKPLQIIAGNFHERWDSKWQISRVYIGRFLFGRHKNILRWCHLLSCPTRDRRPTQLLGLQRRRMSAARCLGRMCYRFQSFPNISILNSYWEAYVPPKFRNGNLDNQPELRRPIMDAIPLWWINKEKIWRGQG